MGNGIQLPCNATHVLRALGILDDVLAKAGGPAIELLLLNYKNGKTLLKKDLRRCPELYGSPWM